MKIQKKYAKFCNLLDLIKKASDLGKFSYVFHKEVCKAQFLI